MTAHALRYDVNLSILFTELPLLERPAAAAAAGFDAVEFWWPFDKAVPDGSDVDGFVAAIEDAGVQLVGLNFFAGDMPGGDRGLVSWPARSAEFRDNIDVTLALGERLGCTAFNALYGNRVDDVEPGRSRTTLAAENLALAAKAAAGIGAVVLSSRSAAHRATRCCTAADASAVIDRVEQRVGRDQPRLLSDLYHLAVNGDDVHRGDRRVRRPHRARADRRRPGPQRARHRRARPRRAPRRRWRPPATPAGSAWSTSPAVQRRPASPGCRASDASAAS